MKTSQTFDCMAYLIWSEECSNANDVLFSQLSKECFSVSACYSLQLSSPLSCYLICSDENVEQQTRKLSVVSKYPMGNNLVNKKVLKG